MAFGQWSQGGCNCPVVICGCAGVTTAGHPTLSLSSGLFGAYTLTWTGSFYDGPTFVYAFPGSGGCAAVNVNVFARFNIAFCRLQWIHNVVNTLSNCPGGTISSASGYEDSGRTITCSPFQVTWVHTDTGADPFWAGSNDTATITP